MAAAHDVEILICKSAYLVIEAAFRAFCRVKHNVARRAQEDSMILGRPHAGPAVVDAPHLDARGSASMRPLRQNSEKRCD